MTSSDKVNKHNLLLTVTAKESKLILKKLLLDLDINEMTAELSQIGLASYKAVQVYKWLNKGISFDNMSDISLSDRAKLNDLYIDNASEIIEKQVSSDGTIKLLLRLSDANSIECVLMKYKYGNTLCISSQAGCRMGCKFCASTLNGLVRNLSAGELLSQVITVNKMLADTTNQIRNITNIVLMGCGEPLDNYDNVIKFLKLVNCESGLNISLRNISLSTCGIVPNIYKLADSKLPVNLTVSLHQATQEKRILLMPIAKKYTVSQLIEACIYYFNTTHRRVYLEYTLISGYNDSMIDAFNLANCTKGYSCHVNLIRLNNVTESNFKPSSATSAKAFLDKLTSLNVSATLRRQIGNDIDGACGQLRNKFVGDKQD